MSETLSTNNYDDTETDFKSAEYALDIEGLREHFNNLESEMGKRVLKNLMKIELSEE